MRKRTILFVLFVIFIILSPFFLYLSKFYGPLSNNDQVWANFGSFYGGIVSSIFAALSFIVVLIIYSRDNQNKSNDKIDNNILKYLDVLSSRYQKITVNLQNQRIVGTDVFNHFNVLALQIQEKFLKYETDLKNKNLEDEIKSLYLTSVFYRNSIREYLNIVLITHYYIVNNKRGKIFLPLLSAYLTEQEAMSFAILKHIEIANNPELKEFIKSLEAGSLEGWKKVGIYYEKTAKEI